MKRHGVVDFGADARVVEMLLQRVSVASRMTNWL
jgi:hypothetical protein